MVRGLCWKLNVHHRIAPPTAIASNPTSFLRPVKMSTFALPNASPPCTVSLPANLTREQLLSFRPFNLWLSTLQRSLSLQQAKHHAFHASPYKLRSIDVQAVDIFGGKRIGFLKIQAEVSNDDGEWLPGAVFLRGGSVAMLVVLQPDDVPASSETDKHVLLALQPRVAAGSLSFTELPAGMIDDSGTFSGAAAKEILEETGLRVSEDSLINLSELALASSAPATEAGERLQDGVYPSPGACDEFIPIFLHQRRVPRSSLGEWKGKLTGLREHGEKITLRLCRLEDLWKVAARDGKSVAAWALYQGLKAEGKI